VIDSSRDDTLPTFPALSDRYRVDSELGRGGMATVYLAHDERHDRKVALKVLHPDLAAALGAQRFLAEIRTTANLQHPHIVPLHDSGEAGGMLYYVMPFVEGESLRHRLERERQLPIEDAVRIATEVADALAYAHTHGVIHRDIKPENILLHGGHAMVADFGIALAVQQAGTARMTQTGLSLGTPQYMSPEQAAGESTIDARSDVYALGAITYEMLTGEPPFTGNSVQAIVARILSEEPRPIAPQRKSVPPHVENAVLKALAKIPADRFATASQFAAALNGSSAGDHVRRTPARGWAPGTIALAAVSVILAAALLWSLRGRSTEHDIRQLSARVVTDSQTPSDLSQLALSADGSQLAYVSSGAFDGGRIWLRNMSDGAVHPIPGTEGARFPFWSPDGKSVGFFSAGMLRVVSLAMGAVRTLAPVPNLAPGGSWSTNGQILYSPFFSGLWSVPASGGEPHRFSEPGKDDREPSFLPDGRHFFYWRAADAGRAATFMLGDLETGKSQMVAANVSSPRYVAPGYVLFFTSNAQSELEQPGALFLQRFDVGRLALVGDPITLSQRVERPIQYAAYTAAGDLLLTREAHASSASLRQPSIFWLNRSTGKTTSVNGNGPTWTFRIAHDGRRVAFGGLGLWLYDPDRDVSVRVPTKAPAPWPPLWSPDDREIAVENGPQLSVITVDGNSSESLLKASDDLSWSDPVDWGTDGAIYVIRESVERRPQRELWRYIIATSRNEHVQTGPGNVIDAVLSPDGKWLAWESDATGRAEIYLGPRAGSATPTRVSKSGGGTPRWRRDGQELFYVAGDGHIVAVNVQLGEIPVIGEPHNVSGSIVQPEPFGTDPFLNTRFDVSPAGDRLLIQLPPDPAIYSLSLVQGWQSRLPR
jgi:serine/threonine-protein kinase